MGIFNGKKEYNYFESFLSLAKYASASANYLCEAFDPFDIDKVPEHVVNMHQLEHDADVQNHEITRNLAHEFITPIEREDIAALAQELDSIVDAIEDVMRRIYMFNVTSLRSEALDFTRLIVRCAAAFENVMGEFQHFKRSKTITTYIIEVNTLENEGTASCGFASPLVHRTDERRRAAGVDDDL